MGGDGVSDNDMMTLSGPGINAAFAEKAERLNAAFQQVMNIINDDIPNGRVRSVAITNLETASMWAGRALLEAAQAGAFTPAAVSFTQGD